MGGWQCIDRGRDGSQYAGEIRFFFFFLNKSNYSYPHFIEASLPRSRIIMQHLYFPLVNDLVCDFVSGLCECAQVVSGIGRIKAPICVELRFYSLVRQWLCGSKCMAYLAIYLCNLHCVEVNYAYQCVNHCL